MGFRSFIYSVMRDVIRFPMVYFRPMCLALVPAVLAAIPVLISQNPRLLVSAVATYNSWRSAGPIPIQVAPEFGAMAMGVTDSRFAAVYPFFVLLVTAIAIFVAMRAVLHRELGDLSPYKWWRLLTFLVAFPVVVVLTVASMFFGGYQGKLIVDAVPRHLLPGSPIVELVLTSSGQLLAGTIALIVSLVLPALADGHARRGVLASLAAGFRNYPALVICNFAMMAPLMLVAYLAWRLSRIVPEIPLTLNWGWTNTGLLGVEVFKHILILVVLVAGLTAIHRNAVRQ